MSVSIFLKATMEGIVSCLDCAFKGENTWRTARHVRVRIAFRILFKVVLFYKLPAAIQGKDNIKNWLEVQAVNEDFKKLRDDIVLKVTPLIDSLKKR